MESKLLKYMQSERWGYLNTLSKSRLIESFLVNEEKHKQQMDKYESLVFENERMRESWKKYPSPALENRRLGKLVSERILDFKQKFIKKLEGRKEWENHGKNTFYRIYKR